MMLITPKKLQYSPSINEAQPQSLKKMAHIHIDCVHFLGHIHSVVYFSNDYRESTH